MRRWMLGAQWRYQPWALRIGPLRIWMQAAYE